MTKLNAKRVHELIVDSLGGEASRPEKTIIAEGITRAFGLHADKLDTN